MSGVVIVSGCPGSGKTTLAGSLAMRSTMGVHLVTDTFYDFLAHPLDPSTPESHAQNTAVVRAFLRAARSFADDGYEVFVDAVLGPWWLEVIDDLVPGCEYVLLHADLETVLRRTRERLHQPASERLVRTMHAQFERYPAACRLETGGRSADAVLEEFLARRAAADFRRLASADVPR